MADKRETPAEQPTGWTPTGIAYTAVSVILGVLYFYGAAKLSYSKYGSILWAILAFIFAPFYYPFYAIFLHTTPTCLIGGVRRMKMKSI
jgi:hypothetical protein